MGYPGNEFFVDLVAEKLGQIMPPEKDARRSIPAVIVRLV